MRLFGKSLIAILALVASLFGLLFAIEAYGSAEFRKKCEGNFVDHRTDEERSRTAFFILRRYGLPNRIASDLYGTLTLDIPDGIDNVYRTYYVTGDASDDLLFITDVGERTKTRGSWSWVSNRILIHLTDDSFFEGMCNAIAAE